MFRPAYRIRIGSSVIESGAVPASSTIVAVDVALDLDTPADLAILDLGRVNGTSPSAGDTVAIDLGYEDSLERIYTGEVNEVRSEVTRTRMRALSGVRNLLALRVDRTYLNTTAGAIVRDLAQQADILIGNVEDGIGLPVYVADERRTAYQHAWRLARKSGFEVYVNAEGELTFRSLTGFLQTHLFGYGEHLLSIEVNERPAAVEYVEVFGESPIDSQGSETFAWLAKRFRPGEAGAGSPTLHVEDASLRTHAVCSTAARAAARRVNQRTLTGRLCSLGRPQVKLGDAVSISGAPDDRMNQRFQIRSVRHRLTKLRGFTTEIAFWSLSGGRS